MRRLRQPVLRLMAVAEPLVNYGQKDQIEIVILDWKDCDLRLRIEGCYDWKLPSSDRKYWAERLDWKDCDLRLDRL